MKLFKSMWLSLLLVIAVGCAILPSRKGSLPEKAYYSNMEYILQDSKFPVRVQRESYLLIMDTVLYIQSRNFGERDYYARKLEVISRRERPGGEDVLAEVFRPDSLEMDNLRARALYRVQGDAILVYMVMEGATVGPMYVYFNIVELKKNE